MKNVAALTLESEVSLVQLARGLRAARLSRGESQLLAAERIGVGLSTYQRLESTRRIPGVAAGTLFTALSIYGLSVSKATPASFKPVTAHNPIRLRAAKKQAILTVGAT